MKYRDTPYVGKPLAEKTGYILSDLLSSLLGPSYQVIEVFN